jgi:hypothetical protein
MENKYLVRNPEAVFRIIEGEAVILTLHDNKMHILNLTGTKIWELTAQPIDIDEVVIELCNNFEVSRKKARKDAIKFISHLLNKKILKLANNAQN